MKKICMNILRLILPVNFKLEIQKKISDVKNHISPNMHKHISDG